MGAAREGEGATQMTTTPHYETIRGRAHEVRRVTGTALRDGYQQGDDVITLLIRDDGAIFEEIYAYTPGARLTARDEDGVQVLRGWADESCAFAVDAASRI